MSGFMRVCATTDIPDGTIRAFTVGHSRFVIANTPEGFFAVANECTHDGEPIATGRIRNGHEIMCTRHGARFDLRSGAVTAPPAIVPIDTFRLKIEGNDVFVWLDD